MDDRRAFLMEMYRQMFADINRHMTVVWQSISVVVGAFAVFALVEGDILPIDLAVALVLMLCAWLYAHMLDAAYWYNRNLAIISNIERQFLRTSDLAEIQYYFGAHRSKSNRMITHLRIQSALGIGIALLMLLFHGAERVWPGLDESFARFEIRRALPYLTAIGALWFCGWLAADRRRAYAAFLENSPGLPVETEGVAYGAGHQTEG